MPYENFDLDERLSVRVPDGLKDDLAEIAKRDHRTLSNLVIKVLADFADASFGRGGAISAPVDATHIGVSWQPPGPAPEPARSVGGPDSSLLFPSKEADSGDQRAALPRHTTVDVSPSYGDDVPPTLMLEMMVAEGESQDEMLRFVLENFDCEACPNCGHEDAKDSYGARFFSIVNPDGRVRCVSCRTFFYPGHDFAEM